MKLAHREGSYLFVHAGLDDVVANTLYEHGVDHLNQEFSDLIHGDPFEFIAGFWATSLEPSTANLITTSLPKARKLHRAGIYAIVHGAQYPAGTETGIREGMLNFECDASVDCNTI